VAAHQYGFEFWGIRTTAMVDSQARVLHWAVTGRPVPGESAPGKLGGGDRSAGPGSVAAR
jgi:hypothetical protein